MPVQAYAGAISLSSLQVLFLNEIIALNGSAAGDRYYDPIEQLCVSVPDASCIGLFDLCRASYVKRTFVNGREIHVSDAKIVKERPDIFARYVEAETPEAWLWRRLEVLAAITAIAQHSMPAITAQRWRTIMTVLVSPGNVVWLEPRPKMKSINDANWCPDNSNGVTLPCASSTLLFPFGNWSILGDDRAPEERSIQN